MLIIISLCSILFVVDMSINRDGFNLKTFLQNDKEESFKISTYIIVINVTSTDYGKVGS